MPNPAAHNSLLDRWTGKGSDSGQVGLAAALQPPVIEGSALSSAESSPPSKVRGGDDGASKGTGAASFGGMILATASPLWLRPKAALGVSCGSWL
jgi:hypothetical protein